MASIPRATVAECRRGALLSTLPTPRTHYGTTYTMPTHHYDKSATWWRRWWRALAAEALGTALLVLLGCACVRPGAALGAVALGWGCVVTALAAALGPVSGAHLNPAVTLGAVVARTLRPLPAAAYVAAQCLGAVAGYGALWALDPALHAATTHPVAPLGALHAAGVECALTGTLTLVVCALWAAPPDPTGPLRVGLAVAGLVVAGGELSGASLNPARSLAPALLHGDWADHWVYWVGPLSGAALAAAAHRWLLHPLPPAASPAPADTPLRDVKHEGDD